MPERESIPLHNGDGRSRDSAVHFPDAAGYEEHVAPQYRWLEVKGLQSEMQAVAAMEGGWIYDVHYTAHGRIWFKLPDPFPGGTTDEPR